MKKYSYIIYNIYRYLFIFDNFITPPQQLGRLKIGKIVQSIECVRVVASLPQRLKSRAFFEKIIQLHTFFRIQAHCYAQYKNITYKLFDSEAYNWCTYKKAVVPKRKRSFSSIIQCHISIGKYEKASIRKNQLGFLKTK